MIDDGVPPAEPASRGLTILLAAASSLGPVSSLMLMPALPAIRADFGGTIAATQSVISVFLIVFAIGIPLAGPLSDRYGRRPLLVGGIFIFLIGSLLGALAPSLEVLVLAAIIGVAAFVALPETRAPSGRSSFRELGEASRVVLRNRIFLSCVIDAGVIYAVYLGFISIAPHIMSEMLGEPATSFGLYLLLLSTGYFLGNMVVTRLKGHADLDRVARFGIWLQAGSVALAFAFVLAGFTHPLFWFGPMLPLAFAQGLALPHITATAVRLAPGYAGVTAGLIGFSQQSIAAAAVQGLGFVRTDTPVPALAVCTALACVSLGAMLLIERALRAQSVAG